MPMTSQETLSCDVLVVGGGGAGLRSAVAAKANNSDVLLVSKSKIGSASNTYISKSIIASTGWGTPDDGKDVHLADTVEGGCFLNDQAMAARIAERSHDEIAFLKDCGVHFDMHVGALRVMKTPGHRYARHVCGINRTGGDLVRPLKRRAEQVGVRFLERVFVTRLMTADGRILGAAGITDEGRFLSIHAKAVILATGGYAQIYLNTNNVPGITGDGQALAYEAGVPVRDMEFVQFYPTAAGKRGSRLVLYENILVRPGVVLRNGRGEDVLKRHGVAAGDVTRDRLSRIIAQETARENSSDGGVFMDTRGLAEEAARQMSSILPAGWWKGDKVLRVAPTAHFCMGGIVVGPYGETCVDGLFAVGEAAGGAHGANRLGGNALAEIFTLGSLVGESAARHASEHGPVSASEDAFQAERSRLAGIRSNEGLKAKDLILRLKRLMSDKVGVIREEGGLEGALQTLREPCPQIAVSSPAELIRLSEYRNMRCVAELVCRAALERTESRGSHFRTDYPEEDNRAWLKNIILRKTDAGMSLDTKPAIFDPAELS